MTSKIRVVVADDHPLFREGVVNVLGRADDIEVVGEADNASAACARVAELKPDICMLDVSMPGGGIEAARSIATSGAVAKIIMLTVSENDDDILAALKAGAIAYVLKGVGSDDLLSVIRNVNQGMSYVSPALAAKLLIAMNDPAPVEQSPDQLIASLTHRETQILRLVSGGLSNKEVGRELELQEKTVKHYMTTILQKLHAKNRVEAAVKARDVWRAS